MQEKHLYEYAVIRAVPRVEREEFVNVGLILFCKSAKMIKVRCAIDKQRLLILDPELDIEQLQLNLESFEHIGRGLKSGGRISEFDMPSRFRWLTAIRSSVIQTSRPHPGMSCDLERDFDRLYSELVL